MHTRIKELRARHNLTQEELAEKVGVTRTTISFLEKGKYNPSLKLAKLISLTLGESIDAIFLWEKGELE
jgi:putative transcriptional regulator